MHIFLSLYSIIHIYVFLFLTNFTLSSKGQTLSVSTTRMIIINIIRRMHTVIALFARQIIIITIDLVLDTNKQK